MTTYAEFLERKRALVPPVGVDVDEVHQSLFPHQAHVVRWAAKRGRAAVFLDTGLGKTRIQLEWARQMGGRALIIAPLSIARQTIREAAELGSVATYVRSADQVVGPGIFVTNYEMQHQFTPELFDAVVLDESSILKNHTGATRNALVERWASVPYRLACTATPAPNDVTELANHAEFLGAMSRVEMLAAFFVHDDDGWRPKGHASAAMYRWMSTWAIAARRPSDLGPFDDTPYVLPPLRIHGETVEFHDAPEGQLFATGIGGVSGRSKMRKATMAARIERAVELVTPDRPSIVWCGLNDEAAQMAAALEVPDLHGSLAPEAKAELIEAFIDGEIPHLVTKVSLAGFGLNLQRATRQIFVGLGDSYEAYYQAIRRSWRFGQTEPVDVHIVVAGPEEQIVDNVRRKEAAAAEMSERLVAALSDQEAAAA